VKVIRVRQVPNSDGQHYGYRFTCPGCNDEHVIPTKPHPQGWDFTGDEDRPTFAPSILVHAIKRADGTELTPLCHSFVRDGRIEFLGDCTHKLAGQTVELPEAIDYAATPAVASPPIGGEGSGSQNG
jgi:hypothetical protein